MNNTVNLLLNNLGNDQSNFFDEVYSANDQMEQIRSIQQFSDLKWDAVLPHIYQILDIYEMLQEYNHGRGEDNIETVSVHKFKELFEQSQFAARNFLQSEAMRDFWKKIQKDEVT